MRVRKCFARFTYKTRRLRTTFPGVARRTPVPYPTEVGGYVRRRRLGLVKGRNGLWLPVRGRNGLLPGKVLGDPPGLRASI
jgi:hypothetical protein